MKNYFITLFTILPIILFAQKRAEIEVIKVNAVANKSTKTIELNWETRNNGVFTLFKRSSLDSSWGVPIKTFTFNENKYVDSNILVGVGQEYHLAYNGNSGAFGHGYL